MGSPKALLPFQGATFLGGLIRNTQSRDAILRSGAKFEGILRQHRGSYAQGEIGTPRDTAAHSIIAREWPDVKAALHARLV